ncbi:MAG: FlgD immunoglobulin-like domain containing protein [Candidatus Hatepunaea meridiana]|nr:FlgD immunoglobulin-like domain containing protein [Candidatus Hatepunaea meridiana]
MEEIWDLSGIYKPVGWTTPVRHPHPKRDLISEISFNVEVRPVNDPPRIVDAPDVVQFNETELVQFQLIAEDIEDNPNELSFTLLDDESVLDRGAQFTDNGDGTASFTWQTGYDDGNRYVLIIMVMDSGGGIDAIALRINVINLNRPPGLRERIGDIEFDEDDDEHQITILNDHFTDPDGGNLLYEVQAVEGIVSRIDDESNLYLQPWGNWNGETDLIITASDGEISVNDTIHVMVNAINDLPTPFNLLSPANSDTVWSRQLVGFRWETSIDEVEDSTITYSLQLELSRNNVLWFRGIEDTTYYVEREQITDENQYQEFTWTVWAYDGIDSTSSNERFNLIVPPLLAIRDIVDILPIELSLGPIYPNPFNEVITINFALPVATKAVLSIYDPLGRQVVTLESGDLSAGRYSYQWNGINQKGQKVSSGLYICRLITTNEVLMQRLVLLR